MNKALAILLSVATTGNAYAGRSGGDINISSGSIAAQVAAGVLRVTVRMQQESPGGEPGESA